MAPAPTLMACALGAAWVCGGCLPDTSGFVETRDGEAQVDGGPIVPEDGGPRPDRVVGDGGPGTPDFGAPTEGSVLDTVAGCDALFSTTLLVDELDDQTSVLANWRFPVDPPTFADGEVRAGPHDDANGYTLMMSQGDYGGEVLACAVYRGVESATDTTYRNIVGLGLRGLEHGVILNLRLDEDVADLDALDGPSFFNLDRRTLTGWVPGGQTVTVLRYRSGDTHYAEVKGIGPTRVLRATTAVAPDPSGVHFEMSGLESTVAIDRVIIGRPTAAVRAAAAGP